ncbi:hypothetical protein C8E03_103233 [Lachnotalea glycerini]|uniref:Mobilization protein n=1 Tax=Lachnotalea glycerini TaxID=1763509 RepID=A0A318ENL1_9FIRM|nr:hypothetical protein [Lachnotalea glycerini]OYO76144.1 hypothetical protein CG709_16045 [Lachnotalea glycerini]PXV91675.1 hypothetical protein C8E03_103233 [Lachnotalea glycerini]
MSERRCDMKNRWRNVVVAFRMSPQEAEDLNVKVALSGLSKQDYLIDCCLKHEIRVVCGKKVAKKMQVYLEAILEELQFMEEGVVPEEEILAPLQHILEILNKDEEKEDLDYGKDII